jgi:hypothetical protein
MSAAIWPIVPALGMSAAIWPIVPAQGSLVVKALCYKPEGRRFETLWSEQFLLMYLILPVALCPGIYLASIRNEYHKQKNDVPRE